VTPPDRGPDSPPFFWVTFHRSPNPMAVLRTDRVFVAVNDAFTDALGYPREQVVGRPADPIIAPGERAAMPSW
jgi:PAS domain S-box-containing protein